MCKTEQIIKNELERKIIADSEYTSNMVNSLKKLMNMQEFNTVVNDGVKKLWWSHFRVTGRDTIKDVVGSTPWSGMTKYAYLT